MRGDQLRSLSIVTALGFGALAAGTTMSGQPSWPVPVVWIPLAIAAAISLVIYVWRPTRDWLDLSTALCVVSGVGRTFGYLFGDGTSPGEKLSTAGVWTIALVGIVFRWKVRRRV